MSLPIKLKPLETVIDGSETYDAMSKESYDWFSVK
jgi:hypothetical protein